MKKLFIISLIFAAIIHIFTETLEFISNELEEDSSCPITEKCHCSNLQPRPAQTYYYYQNTGHFIGGKGKWIINTKGYSGKGQYMNKPEAQCKRNLGPAPATLYKLAWCKDTMHNPPVPRPCSFYMEPQKPDQMCGRSEIMLHGCQIGTKGDTTSPPAYGCSEGCVIINICNRKKLRPGDYIYVRHYEGKYN